jgi:hypothetical protein
MTNVSATEQSNAAEHDANTPMDLASPWHTDADLGRAIGGLTDMSKDRELRLDKYQAT